MAFGTKQFATAAPQLGTSNLPYPTGNLPPFVPVQFNVVDSYGPSILASQNVTISALAATISNLTGAPGIPGTLWAVDADLAAINKTLSKIADNKKTLADTLINLNVAVNAMVVAKNNETANIKVTAINTIKSNNFYMAASTEQPIMPPLEEQIKEALKDATSFTTGATALGFINDTINSAIFQVSTYITGTEIYKTISNKLEEFKKSIFSIFAPSVASIKESLQTSTGTKG